ncbi:MAG: hypothetical protein IJ458_04465 [Clostridia bacterium]|nr:hypothetical protein [Clostridia bacterium]
MKVKIEVVTAFRGDFKNFSRETINKDTAILSKGEIINVCNAYPFAQEIIENTQYLQVSSITNKSVTFKAKNTYMDKSLLIPYLYDNNLMIVNNDDAIKLPINKTIFIDNSIDNVYSTTTIRIVSIDK